MGRVSNRGRQGKYVYIRLWKYTLRYLHEVNEGRTSLKGLESDVHPLWCNTEVG